MSRRFVLKNQSTMQQLIANTKGKLMAPQLDTIDLLRKFPPIGTPVRSRSKPKVLHTEFGDRLATFRQKYPNADPPRVELRQDDGATGGYTSAGFNFVKQQLELMATEGLTEEEAFAAVEERYLAEVDARLLQEAAARKHTGGAGL